MKDILLEDGSVKVIGAVAQRNLGQLQSHADPVSRDVVEVIEINPADGDRAQGIKTGGRRACTGILIIVRLVGQGNEPNKAMRFILESRK